MKLLLLAALLSAAPHSLLAQATPALSSGQNASPAQDSPRPHSHPMIPAEAPPSATFTNPVLNQGPDPWVIYWKGFYYYMNSPGKNLFLIKARDITDLRNGERKVVWMPPPGTPYTYNLWAPELHRWGNKWYIYFAADDAPDHNAAHRIFVVENPSDDPIEGTWTFKGQISKPDDRWAIDPTVFEHNGQHYLVWAGWQGPNDGEQDLYIAHMSNPWTLDTDRILISRPQLAWETHGNLPGRRVIVNEGPEFLEHGSHMFLIFSASGCWTDFYTLGALEADTSADPLNPKSWHKINHPLFSSDPSAAAYGTGHNGFFKSPDGTEDWIIYHANPEPNEGCKNDRTPRIQKFTWNADDTPNFGKPIAPGVPIPKPSGSPGTASALAPSAAVTPASIP